MSVHYRAAHSLRPNARNVAAGTYCCTCCTYYKGVAAKPLGQRRSSSHGQTYRTTRTVRYRRSFFRVPRSSSSFESTTWPKKRRFETASDSRVNRVANRPLYERNFRRQRVSWNGGIAERVDTKTTNSRRVAKTDPRAARSKNQQTWKKEK